MNVLNIVAIHLIIAIDLHNSSQTPRLLALYEIPKVLLLRNTAVHQLLSKIVFRLVNHLESVVNTNILIASDALKRDNI